MAKHHEAALAYYESKRMSIKDYVKAASQIHGNKFTYPDFDSNVNKPIPSWNTKINIECPIHGTFRQALANHLHRKQGCAKCNGKQTNTQTWVDRVIKRHGDRYDYSLVNYITCDKKVQIICNKHGIFKQTPENHYSNGHGCPECYKDRKPLLGQGSYNAAYFDRNPTHKNRTATVYFCELSDKDDNQKLYKIGITTTSLKNRFKQMNALFNITPLVTINMTLAKAIDYEQRILEEYRTDRYHTEHRFNGWTECFKFDNIEPINDIIEKFNDIALLHESQQLNP